MHYGLIPYLTRICPEATFGVMRWTWLVEQSPRAQDDAKILRLQNLDCGARSFVTAVNCSESYSFTVQPTASSTNRDRIEVGLAGTRP